MLFRSDQEKIFAIFVNLVKNAIKYSTHGKITVGFSLKNEILTCFVKDTGIGISKEKQNIIFERFTRVDGVASKNIEGAGLGLSIVKGYLTLMGGEISLYSEPGVGSTFVFTIPVKDSSAD